MQYKVDPEIFKSDLNGADARHVAHEPVDYQLYIGRLTMPTKSTGLQMMAAWVNNKFNYYN